MQKIAGAVRPAIERLDFTRPATTSPTSHAPAAAAQETP